MLCLWVPLFFSNHRFFGRISISGISVIPLRVRHSMRCESFLCHGPHIISEITVPVSYRVESRGDYAGGYIRCAIPPQSTPPNFPAPPFHSPPTRAYNPLSAFTPPIYNGSHHPRSSSEPTGIPLRLPHPGWPWPRTPPRALRPCCAEEEKRFGIGFVHC